MLYRPASSLSTFLVIATALVVCTGCGEKSPFTLVATSGRVTYEDGSPIPGPALLVTFWPQAEPLSPREYPRPASGMTDAATGVFDCLTTVRYGDGATVGPNKVLIVSNGAEGQPTGAVPPEYASTDKTPLVVEVASGHGPYEIKIPKPGTAQVGQR